MAGRRVLYGILLASAVYYSALYTYEGVRFLISILLLLPVAGMAQAVLAGKRCRVFLEETQDSIERGAEGSMEVRVENAGYLPIAMVQVILEWAGPGQEIERKKYWIRGIDGGKSKILTYPVNARHCGRGIFRVRTVKVCDYLGLCSVTRRPGVSRGIFRIGGIRETGYPMFIIPVIGEIAVNGIEGMGLSDRQGTDRDAAEGYEVRGYQLGDSLHRIHWKLTARTDELHVRDYEGGSMDGITLFFNFQNPRDIRGDADGWDAYLDRAVSLLFALYLGGYGLCRASWPEEDGAEWLDINREEDLYACMYRLLALGDGDGDAPELELPPGALHLDMDRRLYLGEQCIYE